MNKIILFIVTLLLLVNIVNADEIFESCFTTLPGGGNHNQIHYSAGAYNNGWNISIVFNGTTNITSIEVGVFQAGAIINDLEWITIVNASKLSQVLANSTSTHTSSDWANSRAGTYPLNFTIDYIPPNGTKIAVYIDNNATFDTVNHITMPTSDGGCAIKHHTPTEANIHTDNWGTAVNEVDKWWTVWVEEVVPVVVSSNIDLLFSNTTNPLIYKSSFGEGEEFVGYLNWTNDADGLAINESFGVCNMTVFEAIVEKKGDFDNFTLCESGCNFSERQKEFDFESITDVVIDSIHFDGCHEQTASGDIDITFSCSGASEIVSVMASEIPLCNGGNTNFVRVSSDACIGSQFINISVNTTGTIPFSQRKRILNSAGDREFTKDIMINGTDFLFNSTLNLWYVTHLHEFYAHGSKTIHGNCSHNTDSNLDNSVGETITIVNAPPSVSIDQVNTSLGTTDLLNDVFIEYASGVWNWFISVSDDDLSFVNVTWYNLTGGIMKSVGGVNISSLDMNTIDQFFLDFDFMPFNLTVFANDTLNANSTVSILFNVTDISAPTITGVDNDTIANLTNYSFTHFITDELVWTYNVSCTDGFSYNQTNINSTSFGFNFSRLINGSLTCTVTACDGHTGKLTKRVIGNRITLKSFTLGDHLINVSVDLESVTTNHYFDRTKFIITTIVPTNKISFVLGEDWVKAYSGYDGHYVNSHTNEWIDFESTSFSVSTKGNIVTVVSSSMTDVFSFDSIGELNCVSVSQTITGLSVSINALEVNVCPNDSTANVLLIWLYVLIAFGLFIIALVFKIYILGFFGGAILTYSYYILVACNDFMSGLIGFSGVIIILVSLFKWLLDS